MDYHVFVYIVQTIVCHLMKNTVFNSVGTGKGNKLMNFMRMNYIWQYAKGAISAIPPPGKAIPRPRKAITFHTMMLIPLSWTGLA